MNLPCGQPVCASRRFNTCYRRIWIRAPLEAAEESGVGVVGGGGGILFGVLVGDVGLDLGDHGLTHGALAMVGGHDGALHFRTRGEFKGRVAPSDGGLHGEEVSVLAIELGDYLGFLAGAFGLGEGAELGEGPEAALVKKSRGSPWA